MCGKSQYTMRNLSWKDHLSAEMSQEAYQRDEGEDKDGVYPPEISRLDDDQGIHESPDDEDARQQEENYGEEDFMFHMARRHRSVVNPPGKETCSHRAQGSQSPQAENIEARGLE